KFLLAKRLKLPDDALFDLRIPFSLLVKLATAGVKKSQLIGALRALNNARNHISHHVESAKVAADLKLFVEAAGGLQRKRLSWPSETGQRLAILKEAHDAVTLAIFEVALNDQ
ncbi:MAG TPA: hypothetical protein VGR43_02565, partial [Dehalococcoidia bacterium]|nr:hypothetical protein [Dehalococcoidia bacterium]